MSNEPGVRGRLVASRESQVDLMQGFLAQTGDWRLATRDFKHCDSVDFDARVSRQARCLDRRSGRVGFDEKRPIDVVHRREIVHVGKKHRRAHYIRVRQSAAFEERADVFQDALGLGLDVAVDHVAGGRVERNLPGNEEKRVGSERRRVRADGLWRARGRNRLFHAAFTTLLDRKQRVQTRIRRTPPLIMARTSWRLGSKRRALTLCAWLT